MRIHATLALLVLANPCRAQAAPAPTAEPGPVAVHVLDAESGEALEGIRVVVTWGGPVSADLCSGPGGVASDAVSPVVLEPDPDQGPVVDYRVRTPRHGWHRIQIDHRVAGARTLVLSRCGALDVETPGLIAAGVELRLRRPGSGDVLMIATASPSGSTPIEGVAPGRYMLRAERGAAHSPAVIVLGEAAVEVRQDRRCTLRLKTRRLDRPRSVQLAGTLELPVEWQCALPRLEIEPLEANRSWNQRTLTVAPPLAMIRGERGRSFRWTAAECLPGRYQVTVLPIGYRTVVNVDSRGSRDVRVVVPRPSRLRVRTIDAATGGPLAAEVRWHTPVAAGAGAYRVATVQSAGDRTLRVPVGRVVVGAQADGYVGVTREVAVSACGTELTIELLPACGIDLRVAVGNQPLEWSHSWRVHVEAIGGAGREIASIAGRRIVDAPGRYRVRIEPFHGSGAPLIGTVTVPPARFAPLVLAAR